MNIVSKSALAFRRPIPTWLEGTDDLRSLRDLGIAPMGAPEVPITVEFVGLTEAEQRAALAAFPGGQRFRLAVRH